MKITILYKAFFYFSIFFSIMSCSKDDSFETISNDELIGIWQLNEIKNDSLDCKTTLKLTFYPDNTGSRIERVECPNGEVTSSMVPLEWSSNENLLTLFIDNAQIIHTTPYSFNTTEQLILDTISGLPFDKID